jgi:hypothetical protein
MQAAPSTNKKTNTLDIEAFTIAPSEAHRVLLGTFKTDGNTPRFHVTYHRNHHLESSAAISYHDAAVPGDDGTYRLFRQFQSWSELAHRITVRFRTGADKDLCH